MAVIPARYGSSRLPGKALLDIGGRPMIEHVYRRAAAAPSVASVIVATDDERILRAVESFGGQARMTSAAHPTGTDRLAEVAAGFDCDIVVNVQGDEPLLDPLMIEEAVEPLTADPLLEMGTVCRRITDRHEYLDPNVVKVVVGAGGFALYFSRAPIPFIRDPQSPAGAGGWNPHGPGAAFRHIGLYVYRRSFLLAYPRLAPTRLERAEALEQLRALEHGVRVRVVETTRDSIGVDTPADLERVRRLVASGAGA